MARRIVKRTVSRANRSVRFGLSLWRAAFTIAGLLVKFLPPSLEIFLHRHFGERYFGQVAGSFCLLLVYRKVARIFLSSSVSPSSGFLFNLYTIAFGLLAGYHFVSVCIFRSRPRQAILSYSGGVPLAFWNRLPVPLSFVQLFAEPVLCFALSKVIPTEARPLAFWIQASSLALAVKGQVFWWRHCNQLFDSVDAQIQARQLNGRVHNRLTGRQANQHGFFAVTPGNSRTESRR